RVGMRSLFDDTSDDSANHWTPPARDEDDPEESEVNEWLIRERKLLGTYLSGHPLDLFSADVSGFSNVRIGDLLHKSIEEVRLVAILTAVSERLMKNGRRMAYIHLDDQTDNIEAVIFEDDFPEEFPALDTPVFVQGNMKKGF